jgi:hypothetical protein
MAKEKNQSPYEKILSLLNSTAVIPLNPCYYQFRDFNELELFILKNNSFRNDILEINKVYKNPKNDELTAKIIDLVFATDGFFTYDIDDEFDTKLFHFNLNHGFSLLSSKVSILNYNSNVEYYENRDIHRVEGYTLFEDKINTLFIIIKRYINNAFKNNHKEYLKTIQNNGINTSTTSNVLETESVVEEIDDTELVNSLTNSYTENVSFYEEEKSLSIIEEVESKPIKSSIINPVEPDVFSNVYYKVVVEKNFTIKEFSIVIENYTPRNYITIDKSLNIEYHSLEYTSNPITISIDVIKDFKIVSKSYSGSYIGKHKTDLNVIEVYDSKNPNNVHNYGNTLRIQDFLFNELITNKLIPTSIKGVNNVISNNAEYILPINSNNLLLCLKVKKTKDRKTKKISLNFDITNIYINNGDVCIIENDLCPRDKNIDFVVYTLFKNFGGNVNVENINILEKFYKNISIVFPTTDSKDLSIVKKEIYVNYLSYKNYMLLRFIKVLLNLRYSNYIFSTHHSYITDLLTLFNAHLTYDNAKNKMFKKTSIATLINDVLKYCTLPLYEYVNPYGNEEIPKKINYTERILNNISLTHIKNSSVGEYTDKYTIQYLYNINNTNQKGSLSTSCMRYKERNIRMKFYDILKHKGYCDLLVKLDSNNKVTFRALTWYNVKVLENLSSLAVYNHLGNFCISETTTKYYDKPYGDNESIVKYNNFISNNNIRDNKNLFIEIPLDISDPDDRYIYDAVRNHSSLTEYRPEDVVFNIIESPSQNYTYLPYIDTFCNMILVEKNNKAILFMGNRYGSLQKTSLFTAIVNDLIINKKINI